MPHGTHKIALHVYARLFKNLKTGENWLNDLPIFCIGLFPFFQNCSIQVKPEFLQIIEDNFLMHTEILPMIVGLVTSILPGLEEKDENIQKKIMDIMAKLQVCVGEKFLTGALWIAILRTPKVRATAIHYLIKIGKKKIAAKEQIESSTVDANGEQSNGSNTGSSTQTGTPTNQSINEPSQGAPTPADVTPTRSDSGFGEKNAKEVTLKKDTASRIEGSNVPDLVVRGGVTYVPRPDCKVDLTQWNLTIPSK